MEEEGEWQIWKLQLWLFIAQANQSLGYWHCTNPPFEIPWHSTAVVTSSKHTVGYKGMFLATKVLAATAIDLFINPNILVKMKKEFDTSRNGYVYTSGISKDKKPPKRIK